MAEVLTSPDDEILFTDYNTPDDFPTFPEAIADTLTEKARQRLRIFRVRPEIHRRFADRTHLKALEPIARNVAIRRSNPGNRWILSTNTDMIFAPRRAASLSSVVRDLPKGYYGIPRFEVPEAIWESFDRKDAAAVIEKISRLGWELHLNEIVYGAEIIKYDAPGDFQLIERADLFAIAGFNEAMLLGWHVDSNIAKRLHLIYGQVGDLVDEVFGYHCDHTRQVTPMHKKGAPKNSTNIFVDQVKESSLPEQKDAWGCANDDIEEVRVDREDEGAYITSLRTSIATPMAQASHIHYSSETFDQISYNPPHVIPYLSDLFVSLPRKTGVSWFGGNRFTLELFCCMWKKLGFSERIMVSKETSDYLKDVSNDTIRIVDISQITRDTDCFVFDFVQDNGLTSVSNINQRVDCFTHYLTRSFFWIVANERSRMEQNTEPRHIIAVNAIHNRFEALVNSNLEAALTPISARIRHGYVAPSPASPPATGRSWLPFMIPGGAGERYRKGIRSFVGTRGHMAFSPCGPLIPGKYRVTAALKGGKSLRSLCRLLHPHWRAPVVCEVVSGQRCLTQRHLYGHSILQGYGFGGARHVLEFSIDAHANPDDPDTDRNVEFRIWTRGKLDLRLTAVTVERVGNG